MRSVRRVHPIKVLSRQAILVAALLLAAAGPAQAQAIKKYITPDGRTIYSDVPVPGAREVGQVAVPPQVDSESYRQADESARIDKEQAQEFSQRAAQANERRERIRAAEQRLAEARATLTNGEEPLPGERIGTAGGASRLTEAYFERQRANQQAVDQAEKNLEAVRAEP